MKEYFELLMTNGVTPNGAMVMLMLQSKLVYSNYLNLSVEIHRLKLSGHVYEVDNRGKVNPAPSYELTLKGTHLLRDSEQMMMKVKPRKKLNVPFEHWEENITQFIALFPAGTQGGQPIRCSPKTLYPRFQWFFLENPEYSWQDVFEAGRAYIQFLESSPEQFKYISTAKYFVMREERTRSTSSKLADWCNSVKEGTVSDIVNHGKKSWEEDVV